MSPPTPPSTPSRSPLRRRLLRRVPPRGPPRRGPRPDEGGRVHGHPRRRVGVVDVGTARRRVRPRLAAAGARRRARARHRGHPRHADLRGAAVAADGVPRDRRRAPHGRARCRGARARRSTTRTRRSASTPSGSSARSSRATPTTPPSSATRSTTSPGMLLFHNRGSFQRFVRPAEGAVRRRRDAQPRVGPDLLVAPARATGPTSGRPTATRCRSTTSPGGATRPTSPPSSSPGRPTSCASTRRPDQFVTTCIAYPRPARRRRGARRGARRHRGQPVLRACRTTSTRRRRLEPRRRRGRPPASPGCSARPTGSTRRSSRGSSSPRPTRSPSAGPEFNLPPYPGQLKQAAFAFISRGAAMIEYWHWHTLPYGTETYWGGVLPHSLVPGRVYAELAEVGADLRRSATHARRLRARRGRRDPLVERQPLRPGVLPAARDRRRRSPITRRTSASSTRSTAASSTRARSRASCTSSQAHAPGRGRARSAVPGARRARRCTSRPTPTSTCCATTRRPAGTSCRHPHGLRRRGGARARRGRARRGSTRPRACSYEEFSNLQPRGAGHRRPGRSRHPPARSRDSWADGLISRRRRRARPLPASAVLRFPRGHDERARRGAHHRRRHACRRPRWPRTSSAGPFPSPVADELAPGRACPSPSHPARCPTADEPGSSSTGDGSRRRSRSRHPSPTPSPETSSRRAPMSHSPPGRRGPCRSVSTKGSCDPTQPQKESHEEGTENSTGAGSAGAVSSDC